MTAAEQAQGAPALKGYLGQVQSTQGLKRLFHVDSDYHMRRVPHKASIRTLSVVIRHTCRYHVTRVRETRITHKSTSLLINCLHFKTEHLLSLTYESPIVLKVQDPTFVNINRGSAKFKHKVSI